MNDWGTSDTMTYDGRGIYFVELDLTAAEYAFKVASEDWATVNFGGNGEPLTLGETATMASSGADIVINLEKDGTYVFYMDASDAESPTIGVFESGMYGATDIFIRGNYNGWSAETAMTFDGRFTYSQALQLSAGELVFKVADADWSEVNKGASVQGNIVTLGQPLQLETNGAGDLTLQIPVDGTYLFQLKGPDAVFPSILVQQQ